MSADAVIHVTAGRDKGRTHCWYRPGDGGRSGETAMSTMFEEEVKMEKRSNILPLLLLLSLVAAVLGVVAYVVLEVRARQPLTADQATPIVAAVLKAQGPAIVHFHGGL